MNKQNVLVINDEFLKKVFSDSILTEAFSVTFSSLENFKSFFENINKDLDLIIVPFDFCNEENLSLLSNVTIPVVVVHGDEINEKQQLQILNSTPQIFDCIPFRSSTMLLARLQHNLKDYHSLVIKKAIDDSELIECDPVSGIYNKNTFVKQTTKMLLKNPDKTYYLLRFDIDHFKVFNETYGFQEGNKLLKAIGSAFISTEKPGITYGHIYGDHFVVCTPTIDYDIEQKIGLINLFLSKLYPNFYFNTRMGIYKIEKNDEDVFIALSRSLLALYSTKSSFEKHYAIYSGNLRDNILDEQILVSEMITALEEEQFIVYLQPQYDYTTQSLSGAEALVRWLHPEKGLIPPIKFIPVFEQNGFITKLDHYMWDHTCALIRRWLDEGLAVVPISVNISRRDIYEQDLIPIFKNLLQKYNLEPKYLNLEITESAYMDHPEQLISVVNQLKELGFTLEMDDFGSGYSSLNTLKDVPVDVLKLDMKFIENSTEDNNENNRGGSILSSVVRMANWLKIPVIAEGIETKIQADYLKSIGCFNMQGYYFAKPMPSADFKELLMALPPTLEESHRNEDVSHALDFLNIQNQTALLFNSFVGGAAIIEWSGDKIEVVRVNDQFCQELNTTREDLFRFESNLLSQIHNASKNSFLSALAESKRSGKESFCEIQFLPIYKESNAFWLRSRLRHIGKTVTSDIYYLAIDNIDFRMQLLNLNTNLSEQLASIMELVPCGVLILHKEDDYIIDFTNSTLSEMLGYTQNEIRTILTRDLYALFPDEVLMEVKEEMGHRLSAPNGIYQKETFLKKKDGTNKAVKIIQQVMQRSDGSAFMNNIVIAKD